MANVLLKQTKLAHQAYRPLQTGKPTQQSWSYPTSFWFTCRDAEYDWIAELVTPMECFVRSMLFLAVNQIIQKNPTQPAGGHKIAKNPPAAANDIRTETMTALAVATSRKNMKIRRPVNAISVMVPTYHNRNE
nr:unnamed protein product [Digitaria exilis]